MRHIQRDVEPSFLTTFKRQNSDRRTHRLKVSYDDLPSEIRIQLREHLVQNQGGLCAYCCCRIGADSEGKGGSHNEHLRPRSCFAAESLDYGNIVASCNNESSCGKAKDNAYDEHLFVSPLDPSCATHFKFYEDGSVRGIDDCGVYTCNLLGLNTKRLKNARKAMIRDIRAVEQSGMKPWDYIDLLQEFNHPNETWRRPEFLDMLNELFPYEE